MSLPIATTIGSPRGLFAPVMTFAAGLAFAWVDT
jgi:hypothetical protein